MNTGKQYMEMYLKETAEKSYCSFTKLAAVIHGNLLQNIHEESQTKAYRETKIYIAEIAASICGNE